MPWRVVSSNINGGRVYHASMQCVSIHKAPKIRHISYGVAFAGKMRPCQVCRPRRARSSDLHQPVQSFQCGECGAYVQASTRRFAYLSLQRACREAESPHSPAVKERHEDALEVTA